MSNYRYFNLRTSFLCGAALLLTSLPGVALAQDVPADSDDGDQIIVTAQKRKQTLLEVPSAVLTLSGEQLRKDGVKDFLDLAQHTPGVIVSNTLVGGRTVQNFTIRGIGYDDFRPNGNPSAAVHFDGIYQGSSALIGGQMFDVQRVEILKGPQGTLYGRNTTAGAVNVISTKPSDQFEGRAETTYSSFDSRRLEAAVNVPLADHVALRVSGLYDHTDGYQTRLGAGRYAGTTPNAAIPPITDPGYSDKVGRSTFYGGRTLLSIGEGTGTELLLNLHAFQEKGGQPLAEPTNGGTPRYSFYGNIDSRRARKNWGASLTLNQDIGEHAVLTVLGGYEWMKNDYDWDDGTPQRTYDILYRDKLKQGSIEARLQNKDSGNFNWTVGAAYFRDKIDLFSTLDGSDTFRTVFEANYIQNRESLAGFADVGIKVAPRLRIDLGVRMTREKATFRGYTDDLNPYGLSIGKLVFPGLDVNFDNRMTKSSPSGRATVTYELADNARLYGSFGRGFRAGGFDGTTIWSAPEALAFKPETVWSYEGGVKFLPRGGPVQIEVAGFYYDFSNIQASTSKSYGTSGAFTSVRTNVGKARSYGGEVSIIAHPVEPMTINVGAAFLSTKILEIESASATEAARRLGNNLPQAPNMTLNGSISYDIALSDRVMVTPQVDARFVGKYYTELDNYQSIGDYTLVNARIGVEIDKRWTVAAFVRNLTDEYYAFGLGGASATTKTQLSGPPRTWGVSAGMRF
ncbi:TonB-dependent receptor [Sphingobium sp. CCH11-B1]|uniref:TonB-dependent receptor n=1 Tax=Sphingobium sp. CCH11-B1 TaxID=1768781 RepID=UPI0008357176|nr:TonB-dependent receptor [Sphingobium sp. CCH11-B1]